VDDHIPEVLQTRKTDKSHDEVQPPNLLHLLNGSVEVTLLIPNRTLLVRFGGISGEFGRAMVRILARRSRAKIPMARANEPDMPPKRTKKVRLGIYRTQIRM